MRYDKTAMRSAMIARWEAAGRRCESCGRPIPDPTPTNFAHRKGRNLSTAAEIENGFFVVCENLHRYEHTRARNLESDPCVEMHLGCWTLRKEENTTAKFWPDRLEYSP